MTWTLDELREKVIKGCDVITLCELLDISESDILDRFEDRFISNIELFEDIDNEY